MSQQQHAQTDPVIPELPPRRLGRSSLRIFLASVAAFMLREMKNQFGSSRLGYFWGLAEPAAAVAIFTSLHAFIRGKHASIYGESPVLFFVFGVVAYFTYSNALSQTQGVCASQRGLFNYRQIKPIDIMVAKTLIDVCFLFGVFCLFILCWRMLALDLPEVNWMVLFGSFTALYLMGFALGLVFEVLGTVFPDVRRIFSILTRPMVFVSGMFFSIGMLPRELRSVLIWNPVLHAVDLSRTAVLHSYNSPASWLYIWGSCLVALVLGLGVYRRYLNQII